MSFRKYPDRIDTKPSIPKETMSKALRDNQKSKVYASEAAAFDRYKTSPEFKTTDECDAFLRKVMSGKVFQRTYPYTKDWNILIRAGQGTRKASASQITLDGETWRVITLPKWARRKEVILHELAHHINDVESKDKPYASHGWEFAVIFLDLVQKGMGKAAKQRLKDEFKARKVYTWERKRSAHTEEHRKMLAERMIRINAAKKGLTGG